LVDAFMVAMLSRPSSGSLRTTRVTTVSIVLAAAAFILFGAVGAVVGLGAGSQVFRWLAVVLLGAFALSSGALALFGLLQRRVSG
jgi:Cu/Ag efflux pump CusA